MDREPAVLASPGTHVRETKEVESFRPALAASCSSLHRIATELDQTRLAFMQFQTELGKPRAEVLQTRRRLAVVFETNHKSSSPGELHPQALTEPDVNLSAHPALIVQSQVGCHETTTQTAEALAEPHGPASEQPDVDGSEVV